MKNTPELKFAHNIQQKPSVAQNLDRVMLNISYAIINAEAKTHAHTTILVAVSPSKPVNVLNPPTTSEDKTP
jgi:hypothetical protein